jgi:2-oxoglutarate dehydrogenase E2 component (dihydrolipoamide succinyltransferase)
MQCCTRLRQRGIRYSIDLTGEAMSTHVIMPQLGESVVEGTISKWLKAVGETVGELDPLVEVNTDKVDTEIPSPAAGVLLEIKIPAGEVARKGDVLAVIGALGEAASAPAPAASAPSSAASAPQPEAAPAFGLAATPSAAAAPGTGRDRDLGFISPVVAKLARAEQVDLHQVPGTGLGGRITKQDVLAYLAKRSQAPAPAAPAAPHLAAPSVGVGPLDELIPHTSIRRAIAEHMVMSKTVAPHVTTVMEVDLSRVAAHREANKAAFGREGVNLTFTAYFIQAIAGALKAYPTANASWSEAGLVVHQQINIGMAVSLGDEGLIVPVLKNADGLSLLGLARAINDLAARARAHKLQPDEVRGGTFTLTNHGISGSLFATPIINQPQCGILGVGIIQKRPVVISDPALGDVIAIRPMVYLSYTFDHRILDGAVADYFLAKVVELLAREQ